MNICIVQNLLKAYDAIAKQQNASEAHELNDITLMETDIDAERELMAEMASTYQKNTIRSVRLTKTEEPLVCL